MRFKKNHNGKIVLLDRKGNEVEFSYPIDVTQALEMVDADGEARYTCPKESLVSFRDEVKDARKRKEIRKEIVRQSAERKGIRTTSGKEVPSEFLIDEENLLDEDFIQSNPENIDNLEGSGENALNKMGFEDPDELDEIVPAEPSDEKPKTSRRGRKPADKKTE
jgi:hypothetical protein